MLKASMKAIMFLSVCGSILGNVSCFDSPNRYGIVGLKIPDGREVFFKREARGIDYDSLALSVNSDPCTGPDPKTDYILHSSELPRIYYKIEDGALALYLSGTATPPGSGQFPVKIIQHKIHPIDYREFEKSYEKMGLRYVEFKMSELIKCK